MDQKKLQNILAHIKLEISSIFKAELQKTILFGSHARGDFHPQSDIDLLILIDRADGPSHLEKKMLREISDRIFLEFDVIVQLFPIPSHLYRPEKSLFYRTVEREGILI
jgi:predicted nucleotidyltransferase